MLGRRDSQVSVGGLKVDLTEVEHTLAALPGGGRAPWSTYDKRDRGVRDAARRRGRRPLSEREIGTRPRRLKRPRVLKVVEQLPRTATGKLVRNHAALAARGRATPRPRSRSDPRAACGKDVTDGATDPVRRHPVKEGNRR